MHRTRRTPLGLLLSVWILASCDDSGKEAGTAGNTDAGAPTDGGGTDAKRPDGPASDRANPANTDAHAADGPVVMRELRCGDPEAACCDGNTCKDGGCCVAARCVAEMGNCAPLAATCKAGSCGGCGGVGQICCSGACTGASTICEGTVCVRCGGAGEPCCASSPADSFAGAIDPRSGRVRAVCSGDGLVCGSNNRCLACGAPGQPCCGDGGCRGGGCCYGSACVAAGQSCGSLPPGSGSNNVAPGGLCENGACTSCGRKDQPCCGTGAGASCHEPGQACKAGRCGSCGGPGELCCPTNGPSPGCDHGYLCALGPNVCQKCGGVGEPCCPGGGCSGNGCCLAGRCHGDGDGCLVNGVVFGACQSGRCGCGKTGEPCCPSFQTGVPVGPACSQPDATCSGYGAGKPGTCARCGVRGGPCCPGQRCTEAGAICLTGYPEPPEGICQACGGSGEVCCPGTIACNGADLLCLASAGRLRCTRCGTASPAVGPPVPCCGGNTCTDGSCCVTGPTNTPFCAGINNACVAVPGTCGANNSCGGCGGLNEPCCGNQCTAAGTHCPSIAPYVCSPCGKAGQPCCRRYRDTTSEPPACEGALKCTFADGAQVCAP